MFSPLNASRKELESFLGALFLPTESIELRLIENWSEEKKTRSRLIDRRWVTPQELNAGWQAISEKNRAGANVFFGVNPRRGRRGKKEDVATCRVLWADLDDARPGDHCRWSELPPPSFIVDSGRGVHLYWRLQEVIRLSDIKSRTAIEQILKGMYRTLQSDSVQDVSRLLRLPNTSNVKDLRLGRPALPCQVVECHKGRLYHLEDFQHLAVAEAAELPRHVPIEAMSFGDTARFHDRRTVQRIRGLIRLLERPTEDRSKRDFFVVSKLAELGCSPEEARALVEAHSKFSGNEPYLVRTIFKAFSANHR